MTIQPIESYPMPTEEEMPTNRMAWKLDPRRAVLLIHDMQRYFVDVLPRGASPTIKLIDNIRSIRRAASSTGVPVVYTAQPGSMTRKQRGLLQDIWGPGMANDPVDNLIVHELAPAELDTVLTKWRYSAFTRSNLAVFMDDCGRDQLMICGVYAHVGVIMTAFDAFSRDIETFLVADAIADFSEYHHRLTLQSAAELCAMTVTSGAVVNALNDPIDLLRQVPDGARAMPVVA